MAGVDCVQMVRELDLLDMFVIMCLYNTNMSRKKIPSECKPQRNCQLIMVSAAVGITVCT